jgi:hypothetical protein
LHCTAGLDPCGPYSQDLTVLRVIPVDDIGERIPSARVTRIDKDVGYPEGVPINRLALLDPGGGKGRSAMTLVIRAPGFLPDTLRLPQVCALVADPELVFMRRAP